MINQNQLIQTIQMKILHAWIPHDTLYILQIVHIIHIIQIIQINLCAQNSCYQKFIFLSNSRPFCWTIS